MQFLLENRLKGCQIFGQFSFLKPNPNWISVFCTSLALSHSKDQLPLIHCRCYKPNMPRVIKRLVCQKLKEKTGIEKQMWSTHSFRLSGDDLPECGTCQCPLAVKHILDECVDLNDVQNKHFVASSIKDLFDNIEAHKIIDFIKETRFYKQL